MPSRIIHIEDIGDIQFVKNNRSKNISITIKSINDIKVSVPARVSFSVAKLFVREQKDWIKQHVDKLKYVQLKQTIFDERTKFRTKKHTLRINKTTGNDLTVNISGGEILVNYPARYSVEDEPVQFMTRRGIEEALRIEAKLFIPPRAAELAEMHNFRYNKVFIKNNKSRWGSCSRLGNLNYSLHLMMLPDELIDYVILHELAHTVEHNHSKNFWAVLDNIYGDSKAVDKKLKGFRIGIY